MRNASDTLITQLNTSREYNCCDLYKIVLRDGSVFCSASYDIDVVYNNNTYLHDFLIINRSSIKITGEPTVDSLSVTIYADRQHNDTMGEKFIMKAAHDGIFDGAYLTLTRAFFNADGSVMGGITLFNGRCEVSSCTGFVCKLAVKSELTGLAALFPLRIFAPQNSYSENSGGEVVTSSTDEYTCAIPLKPSQNVLVRIG